MLKRLLGERLIRRTLLLSSGMMLGQLSVLLIAPILTRIYDPEAFGTLAVFSALIGVLTVAITLRYEYVIPVCPDEEDARTAAKSCILITIVLSLLSLAVIAGFAEEIAGGLALGGSPDVLYLIPLMSLFWGFSQVLSYWFIRHGHFSYNSKSIFTQLTGQAVVQLALGFMGLIEVGLVAGYSCGQVIRFSTLLYLGRRDLHFGGPRLRLGQAVGLLRRYRRYALFTMPSGMIDSLALLFPAIVLSTMFGPAVAGLFGLAQRMLGIPVKFLGDAASQAFLGEIRVSEGDALHALLVRTVRLFTGLAFIGLVALAVAGPAVFAFVFGENWRASGEIARILGALYAARFVAIPITQVLNALDLNFINFVASTCVLACGLVALQATYSLGLSYTSSLWIYSLGGGFGYAMSVVVAWRVTRARVVVRDRSDRL